MIAERENPSVDLSNYVHVRYGFLKERLSELEEQLALLKTDIETTVAEK